MKKNQKDLDDFWSRKLTLKSDCGTFWHLKRFETRIFNVSDQNWYFIFQVSKFQTKKAHSLVYFNKPITYRPLLAIQIVKFETPLAFAIVELKPPNMFVEILCRCETSFAHASLCLKYHAADRTSTIILTMKTLFRKLGSPNYVIFNNTIFQFNFNEVSMILSNEHLRGASV